MARNFNITSPGVEISEKDLSLRIETPIGTQVLVPGFACQGPISEIIQVTSVSELETIFGTPTNAAERYFYYSCREVLASPAVLNAVRLPYGAGAGEGYSQSYSALLYPISEKAVSGDSSKVKEYEIGAPSMVALTPTQYNKIKLGYYSFNSKGTSYEYTAPAVTLRFAGAYDVAVFAPDPTGSNKTAESVTLAGSTSIRLKNTGSYASAFGSISKGATVSGAGISPDTKVVRLGLDNDNSRTGEIAVNQGSKKPIPAGTSLWIDGREFVVKTLATLGATSIALNSPDPDLVFLEPGQVITGADPNGSASDEYFQENTTVSTVVASGTGTKNGIVYLSKPTTATITAITGTLSGVKGTMVQVDDNSELNFNCGFMILNDLQTTINDVGEGYYIGLADSQSIKNPNFDSIKKVHKLDSALTETNIDQYKNFDTETIMSLLTATEDEDAQNASSISQTLEGASYKVALNQYYTEYQDFLRLGVFKLSRAANESSKLVISTASLSEVSLDAKSVMNSASSGQITTSFIENTLISNAVVKAIVNPSIANDVWRDSKAPTKSTIEVKVNDQAKALFPLGNYVPLANNQTSTKIIGDVDTKIQKVFNLIENPDNFVVDVIVDAGLSTVNAATKSLGQLTFDDARAINNGNITTLYKQHWQTVVSKLITFAQMTRRDCLSIIDLPRFCFVKGKDGKVLEFLDSNFTTNVYNEIQSCVGALESNYAATYGNWVKILDSFSGSPTWLPFSGYAAAIFGRSDEAGNVWAAPAGFNRGEFSNVVDIAINPNQRQRDKLYELGVNPVVYFNGDGYTVFGQKTLQTRPTAFDRINVRRLFLYLERAVSRTVKYFVFEPNTDFTRKRVKDTISPIFNYAKANQGLYDYMIVCDERNNTPEVVDENTLVVDIYLKPVRTAEFILVNFIATRTGQNFQELL